MEKHNLLDVRLELPEWFFNWRRAQGEQEVEEKTATMGSQEGRGWALGEGRGWLGNHTDGLGH